MKGPKILFLTPTSSAIGYYRHILPARLLTQLGYDVTYDEDKTFYGWMKPDFDTWLQNHLGKFDLVFAYRPNNKDQLGKIRGFVHNSPGCRLVVDFDDNYHEVPDWNMAPRYRKEQDFRKVGDMSLKVSELCTVSTEPLKEAFIPHTHALAVAHNMIDLEDWEGFRVDPDRSKDPRVRILYGGANGHYGDLDQVRPGLEAFLCRPPVPIRMICFGALPRWMHELRQEFPDRIINLPWTPFDWYARAVAWGGFDFAIAPLAEHPFNDAKSEIKWTEAAAQGTPLLASDTGPYARLPEGALMRVPNTREAWFEALSRLSAHADERFKLKVAAREALHAGPWPLAKGAELWRNLIDLAMSRPRIETVEDTRLPRDKEWLGLQG